LRLVADPGARLAESSRGDDSADASTVVTMYRPESLQVRVDVRFEDLPKVSLNQPVRIASPAVSKPLEGQVLFISSEANIQKNTLQVKVALESPPEVFKPEMLVDVTFLAPAAPPNESAPNEELRLLVSAALVHEGPTGSFVWLADQSEGVAKRVPVEIGPVSPDGLIEVTRGLNISSRIIVSGHEGLDDGDRIRVTGEAAPPSKVAGTLRVP
jgi:multidrug efflux pump subunit AcrA (membrane-fusion protein)